MISRLEDPGEIWDFLIVGGGATGVGIAVDASSRGYSTLLIEQNDFGKGTSSRSTKLIHGGVRYLQQRNVSLVYEALKERGNLIKNAPHLVRSIAFVVPGYDIWGNSYYGAGLKLYDMLAGRRRIGRSKWISRKQMLILVPTIEPKHLRGGVIYHDAQFDDSRLLINLAQTAAESGAGIINYFKADDLIKENGKVKGVTAVDLETLREYKLKAKVVINATGIFSDNLRKIDRTDSENIIKPSQGVHIVLNKSFLPGKTAVLIPQTDDGRVLFAIPWKEHVLIGTTDTPVKTPSLEPLAKEEEITFLLSHISRYLTKKPEINDVLSIFAGIRPLINDLNAKSTASLSRDYKIEVSQSNLLTVAGGKWTTYRKMAEDTVNTAIELAGLKFVQSTTKNMQIHGYCSQNDSHSDTELHPYLKDYGSDSREIEELIKQNSALSEELYPSSGIFAGEVLWTVRHEMARNIEDFLARRRRILFLNVQLGLKMAPKVAEIMAQELKKDKNWIDRQLNNYYNLSLNYLPANYIQNPNYTQNSNYIQNQD